MPLRSPGHFWRLTSRTWWRLSGLVLLGSLVATACSRESCEEGCVLCGGVIWLGSQVVESMNEEGRQLEACGECPAGTICNFMYEPAECRPRPGKVGDRCGRWKTSSRPERNFFCSSGLHCSYATKMRLCSEPAGVGVRCMDDVECRLGLYCSRSAGRVCAEQLDAEQVCTEVSACREGLSCSRVYEPAKCAPLGGQDARCDADRDCLGELVCSDERKCAPGQLVESQASP